MLADPDRVWNLIHKGEFLNDKDIKLLLLRFSVSEAGRQFNLIAINLKVASSALWW